MFFILLKSSKPKYLIWSYIFSLKLWAKNYDQKKSKGSNYRSCLLPQRKKGPKGKRGLSRREEDKVVKGSNYPREQVSKSLTKKYR